MLPSARASTMTTLAAALLLALLLPTSQASPVSSDASLWQPLQMHLARVRRQSVTCDPEIIRKMIQNSCEMRRRRREALQRLPAEEGASPAPAPAPAEDADAAAEDLARRVRSFPTTLIEKCCAETCNERTFAGICP